MKPLTQNERSKLEHHWTTLWQQSHKEDMTAIWYEAVVDFLAMTGHQVIPPSLLNAEESVITKGLAKEYFSSLMTTTGALANVEEEEEKAIRLMYSATVEQRSEAIKKLLNPNSGSYR